MSKLALLGGKPVTRSLLGKAVLPRRRDLERKYLLDAYDRGIWNQGDPRSQVTLCEKDWARFNNARYSVAVTNGTHAIQLALETLEIGPGDEVIVPGLTWQATASAVCDVNAVPVLVDVEPDTLCIAPACVEAAVTSRTRAIIPVHLYNRLADMDALLKIARKHKLHVVEDCSHAHGSRWGQRYVGTLGDMGCFSMQNSKLVTGGEGGMVLARNRLYAERLLSLRHCGRRSSAGVQIHSGNFRLTALAAALIRAQIAALRRNAAVMHRSGLALDKAIADAPGVRPLRRHKKLTRQCGYGYVFRYDPRQFDGLPRDLFVRALSAETGHAFGATYVPLPHSHFYTPHTKRRHQLSKAYVKAITPSRWNLPVVESAWRDEAVVASWRIFACPPRRAPVLTDAIAKIHEQRKDLLTLQK